MKVCSADSVPSKMVDMPGSSGCTVRWLVGMADGAPNFAMRKFEVQPGGFTPRHSHPYEHEVFVLAGEGIVYEGNEPRTIKAGDVIYVAPDEIHQFQNRGDSPLQFLCLIPHTDAPATLAEMPECGLEVK